MPVETLKELAEHILQGCQPGVESYDFAGDELVMNVKVENVVHVLKFLRDNSTCRFEQLIDVTAADYPNRADRFDVIYNLLSLHCNRRVRLRVRANEETLVPTATEIYSTAGWFEREVWDMYGVMFNGNPDLRRILTDYGFEGHPQRKDFPLTGYVEVRYDDELKRVVYEPVKLNQDFRNFDFLSPWEGMTDVQLPGDEKAAKPEHGYRRAREAK
ncbi:MAG: NADH-quinone oxidoreductase subunit C [Alphaproteobacteria bacterium]